MPLQTKPQDEPAVVRFHADQREGALIVSVSLQPQQQNPPYTIAADSSSHFHSRDDFKARAIWAGMSPAIAEDNGRSFNATARQLRELGFSVELSAENQKREKEIDQKRKREESAA